MISKQIQDAINTQINDELWSAYLYLSMSMDAESKGLRGVANWMFVQWKEEQDHARILQQYMIEQNARVVLQPITEVPTKWNSLASMFKDTLSHEKGVTKSINKIATMALEEGDYATFSRMQWFVDEQVEEESSVCEVIDQIEMIGSEKVGMYCIDQQLGERRYTKAEPLKCD